ncbi:MAG: glycosyl hydrolase 53 family protein [Parafilimonas sp.]|nr:glycosyl hydrolase 53 family protein [Parafilimonas sp.]
MKKNYLIILLFVASITGCSKSNSAPPNNNGGDTTTNPPPDTPLITHTVFAKGADISWLTQMESEGYKFYNRNGVQEDLFQVLQDEGMNSIRLRAWVNPTDGWCNTADVVAKAKRAKAAGMRIMIDFHYSDWWADPAKQNKPAAWASLNFNDLKTALSNYTKHVMDTLKANGIYPEWVQVGNETNDGMLWEDGRASTNMANFAALVSAGYDAVKSVFDTAKVIVHISNGYDNNLFRWVFDGLKNNNAKWDVIGMSLYPSSTDWQTKNAQCLSNINDMIARYKKPVMICEVGMSWTDSFACKSFLDDIILKTRSVANGNGLGVFYWEPESYNNWKGYSLGAFDNNGKPTEALDAFKN